MVPQDSCNVQVAETQRDPPSITCSQKPEVNFFSWSPQQDQHP